MTGRVQIPPGHKVQLRICPLQCPIVRSTVASDSVFGVVLQLASQMSASHSWEDPHEIGMDGAFEPQQAVPPLRNLRIRRVAREFAVSR